MTSNVPRATLAIVFVATAFLGFVPTIQAQNTCSMATLAGDWAATLTGTILFPSPTGPVPAAAVLRYNLDRAGIVSGTEARNVGGMFVNETLQGRATVNANCTGTATVNIFQRGVLVRTAVLAVVYDELSTQVRMVQKSLTFPNGTKVPVVVTVEGKKLSGD